MPPIASQLNPRSADFQANAQAMRALVDDLRAQASQLARPAVVVLTLGHAERAMGARVERRHAQQ